MQQNKKWKISDWQESRVFTSKSDRLCVVFNGQSQSPFFKAEADLKLVTGESRDRIEETPLGPVRLDHGLLHSVNKMNSCLEPRLNPSPDCGTNWPPLSY